MPIQDIINVQTSISSALTSLTGFGIALVGADLSGPQGTAWTDLLGAKVTYPLTPSGWPDELEAIGFADGEPLWEWAQAHFGQDTTPTFALVGRKSTAVAQVVTYTIATGAGATPDGNYTATINSTAFTHPASGETGNQVRDALVILINAGAEPVTAAPGGDGVFTVTADEAGVPFTFAAAAPSLPDMTVALTTPNTGLGTDIGLWDAERKDWYELHELTHDGDLIEAAADVIEAFTRPLMFKAQVSEVTESGADDGAVTTDVGSRLGDKNLARTGVAYVVSDTEQVTAALSGKNLPKDAGSITWANTSLRGFAGDELTTAQTTALRSKNYTYYERFAAQDVAMSVVARVADGTPFDLIRGRDWLDNELQTAVLSFLIQQDKVPYTDPGAQGLRNVIAGVLQRAVERGILVADTIVITVPAAASQSAGDRAARNYPGITWTARAAGAIERVVTLTGTIVV